MTRTRCTSGIKCSSRGSALALPEQTRIGWYEWKYLDERGEFRTDTVNGCDIAAWVTQGAIADRSREHLGTTDRGVVMYRQLLRAEIEKVARGEDPMNVFRDPATNVRLELPLETGNKLGEGSEPSPEYLRRIGYSTETNDPLFQRAIDALIARAKAPKAAAAPA